MNWNRLVLSIALSLLSFSIYTMDYDLGKTGSSSLAPLLAASANNSSTAASAAAACSPQSTIPLDISNYQSLVQHGIINSSSNSEQPLQNQTGQAAASSPASSPSASNTPKKTFLERLEECVDLKSFALGLVDLRTDKRFKGYKLFKLFSHFETEELPQLFSTDKVTFEKYFSLEQCKEFMTMCGEDILFPTQQLPERKAALKRCLKYGSWNTLLQCSNEQVVQDLFSIIIDLLYFTNENEQSAQKPTQTPAQAAAMPQEKKTTAPAQATSENNAGAAAQINGSQERAKTEEVTPKIEALEELHEKLLQIEKAETNSLLCRYFNMQALRSIINDLILKEEGSTPTQPVTVKRIIQTIHINETIERICGENTTLTQHVSINHTINFLTLLLATEGFSKDLSLIKFMKCMKWDMLVDKVPAWLEWEAGTLEGFFDIQKLKALLNCMQKGDKIVKEQLLAVLNPQCLSKLGGDLSVVEIFFDLQKLTDNLNRLMSEELTDFKKVVDVPKLEQKLGGGVDVAGAFDCTQPEAKQQKKLMDLVHFVTNKDWLKRFKIALPFASVPVIAWLLGNTICPRFVTMLTPQRWYTAGPLAALALVGTIKGKSYFSTPTPQKTLFINGLMCRLYRFLDKKQKTIQPKDLVEHIPDGHPLTAHFTMLMRYLKPEHLALLPNPYSLLEILDNPIKFIHDYERFFDGLITIDPGNGKHNVNQRFCIISIMLNGFKDPKLLTYFHQFKFALEQFPKIFSFIPPALILIAPYKPNVLDRFALFRKQMLTSNATFTGADGRPYPRNLYALYLETLSAVELVGDLFVQSLEGLEEHSPS